MNDLHVLVIMNLRKASSEQVVSSLGNIRHTPPGLVLDFLLAYETNNLMPRQIQFTLKPVEN
jgi:hypothetical protein